MKKTSFSIFIVIAIIGILFLIVLYESKTKIKKIYNNLSNIEKQAFDVTKANFLDNKNYYSALVNCIVNEKLIRISDCKSIDYNSIERKLRIINVNIIDNNDQLIISFLKENLYQERNTSSYIYYSKGWALNNVEIKYDKDGNKYFVNYNMKEIIIDDNWTISTLK